MYEVAPLYGATTQEVKPPSGGKGQAGFKNTTASGGSVIETE
jgi:hypothetical protein